MKSRMLIILNPETFNGKIWYSDDQLVMMLQGVAPLTLNLANPDPVFTEKFTPLTYSTKMPITAALSNSFGFGGTNASLLFSSADE
ncbi:unnamed protein product [Rhodiola kirilowii]